MKDFSTKGETLYVLDHGCGFAGFFNSSFALPGRITKHWQWKHAWAMWSIWSCLVILWLMALMMMPCLDNDRIESD
jgi:hypothetical protein